MPSRASVFAVLAASALALANTVAHAQAREEGHLLMASQVLEELRSTRDQFIPDRLLERAYGIAVVPDVTKIAFFAGGRHGNGVLVVRDKDGRFSSPMFVSMTGGSFGWQWGVQSTDIVLVFTSRKGVEGITGGKFTLGADASVAAGPIGRQASAATDPTFKAEIYSYSRSRGVFAGVALDGTVLSIDDDANEDFYKKKEVTATQIMSGEVTTQDDTAKRFLAAIMTSTRGQETASASPPAPPAREADASNPASRPSAPAPSRPSTGAQAFPLEDQHPGSEPK
ncbi:MAG TPA: lipid-binding SYLF domain-containing protein [Steroidobacteraceae bacterium]